MRIFTLNMPVHTIGDPEYTDFVDMLGEDWSGKRQALHLINQIGSITDAIDFLFPPHVLLDPMTCIQRHHARSAAWRFRCPQTGEMHCLSRITFKPPRSTWTVNQKKFPLRPAYATTFNGCQGLTLQKAVLDLRTDSFAHGQLYTALSRVRCRRDIRALFAETEDEKTTANVVYKHLLL
ncbi:uncharacterized protein F5891DRAFT_81884 [Suillus fuscotomentosus]|uniref:Uncharacterized protein n=1 Tax=Suillus fuscotomentosus TaxID=1912939 RepID=A0AAD4HQD7_9AGAM|nr:uncharacterized protein F5891DRAFT_156744 [Suillus fuscotomentosus]XP_041229249.1 uncharacterized protein F5891DRAFT_81884 [Suillus fuscotomentosus]KAG1888976.1 hypothetical protein F5891DRAFT_156744 [Suillus fuscotomentosus]KAG1903674.1 hypothetical protein F5891DRAFT_81884 [Suillus fuscotomentosus]